MSANQRIQPFLMRRSAVSGGGILDAYITDCVFAYSTRKLFSSYTGYSMRITLDNVTFHDIGFDSFGVLDVASILSIAGSGDAYVRILYDQSGNGRNQVQTSLVDMPRISIAGSVQYIGAMPSVNFVTNTFLVGTVPNYSETNFVYKISTARTAGSIYFSNTNTTYGLASQQSSSSTSWRANYGTPSVYKNKVLQSITNRGHVYNAITSNPVIIEKSANTSSWTSGGGLFFIGRQVAGAFILEGKLNDIIQYSGSQTLSRLEEVSDIISTGY